MECINSFCNLKIICKFKKNYFSPNKFIKIIELKQKFLPWEANYL